MPSLKDKIIVKIQSSDNEQLLAEVFRILDTEDFVFSTEKILQLNEADGSIDNGDLSTHEQVEKKMKKWLKDLK
jgi:hypothetical protein